jgi:protein-S-isoprenylcysteine O-methyltransferase Ste14
MKLKYFIDWHKGLTFLAVMALMAIYRQWQNPTAWVYLALHGTYGLLWVLKSHIFPDRNWEKKVTIWFGLISLAALTLYWIPAWLLTSRSIQSPPWLLAISISIYTFGVFFHFVSDMQKHISLKLQPNTLITDGMMAYSRNINYFGELLIYLALALLAMTWLAFIPLALFVAFYWTPNMLRKEKSLAKYPGFEAYRRKVRRFIPFLF